MGAVSVVRLMDVDVETARYVHALNDPHGGRIVVRIQGHLKRGAKYPLLRSMRQPLGIRTDVTGGRGTFAQDALHLRAWYRARRIREMVVSNAHGLPAPLLTTLLNTAADADMAVWLLCEEGTPREWREAVAEHAPRDVPMDEFLARYGWPDLPAPTQPAGATIRLPDQLEVPGTGFATFRADVHTHLHEDLADAVDVVWRDAFTRAREFADRDELTPDEVAAHLAAELGGCVGRTEMLTTVRAIEAGLFTCGWVLGVPSAVLGKIAMLPTRAERSPAAWARLFAYGQPFRGAACALYAAQAPLSIQQELRIEDVEPDGSAVRLPDGSHVPIEPGAQVFLAAQVQARLLRGASPSKRLFVWESDLAPMSVSTLQTAVEMPGVEVGFPLVHQITATDSDRAFTIPAHLLRLHGRIAAGVRLPIDLTATPPAAPRGTSTTGRLTDRVLDGAQIRRRRQERHLSASDLAAEVGLRASAITLIETEDAGGELRVHQLTKLAETLDADLGELFITDDRQAPSADVKMLGSWLFSARSMVPLELLAEELGWTLDRLDDAILTLALHLRPAGLTAHRVGGKVSIQVSTAHISPTELERMLRRHRARHGFQWGDAKALFCALVPKVPYRGKPHTQALAVQRLRNAGILTTDEPAQPAAATLFALGASPQP